MSWPYDSDTRDYVARLLWDSLPAFHRVQDQPPRGDDELRRFLAVLGAPLALIRQNIEELHANLFIDTCDEQVIALLAEFVGTTTLFPDADSNRRDVRGTIAWRRRKGTPPMLAQMARELTNELVVLHEGWRRVLLVQDINLVRTDQVLADLRPGLSSESSHGPFDRMQHVLDPRASTERTGRYHPRDVVHWHHPTSTWPLREGTAGYVGNHLEPISEIALADEDPDPDWRYAIHPLGNHQALRARAVDDEDALASDRIPAMHFARDPAAYFAREGRFTIHVASLPAALAESGRETRAASDRPAELELASGVVGLRLLDRPSDRWTRPVELALCVATLDGLLPDPLGTTVRSSIVFDGGDVDDAEVLDAGPVPADAIVLVRLQPVEGLVCFFPGGTLAIESDRPAGCLASNHPELALRGYLRGALVLELPPLWLFGPRWLYLAADGSVVAAQTTGMDDLDVPLLDLQAGLRLDLDHLVHTGAPAAWPAQPSSQSIERITRIPASPGRGPALLHGGRVLDGVTLEPIDPASACALEFAVRHIDAGTELFRPMVRLRWLGSDPTGATWEALDELGQPTDVDSRFAELALWRDTAPNGLRLVLRFVCSEQAARMAPGELAWTAHDGRTYLIHLPEQRALAEQALVEWPMDAIHVACSIPNEPAEDGSCWMAGAGLARLAEGRIAPLQQYVVHQRRRVRWRKLCPWKNETPDHRLAATPVGWLDVDVEHGLFALALSEPPQPWPAGPASAPIPPNVTVAYKHGYGDHVGARPTSRELELDERLATPTRLVTRSGTLSRVDDSSLSIVPRYPSLTAALAAIAGDPNPAEHEVVEIEDDATYVDEAPTWPANVLSLTIQAAEDRRPIFRLGSFSLPPALGYQRLRLIGLAWLRTDVELPGLVLELPICEAVELRWCSVLDAADSIRFQLASEGQAFVDHCVTGNLTLDGPGTLMIRASALDPGKGGGNPAILALEGRVDIERCTVLGACGMFELEASDCLFVETVLVRDRFRGCVRYSAVATPSVLPRRHRVVDDPRVHFVSLDRHDPAHLRLAPTTAAAVLQGAEDGGELGVFHDLQHGARREALLRRLDEYTPTGLISALVRLD